MDTGLSTIILLGLLIAIVSLVFMFYYFPTLERVRASGSLRPEIERIEQESPPEEKMKESPEALDVALRLLEPDERRIVEALLKSGGSMLQKDISYQLEISRVKTHRTLVKLIKRGVVSAEKHYNTNRIELADWLKD
jgi:uncharacterized membrane protein